MPLLIETWPCSLVFVVKLYTSNSILCTFYSLGVFCEQSSVPGVIKNIKLSKIESFINSKSDEYKSDEMCYLSVICIPQFIVTWMPFIG